MPSGITVRKLNVSDAAELTAFGRLMRAYREGNPAFYQRRRGRSESKRPRSRDLQANVIDAQIKLVAVDGATNELVGFACGTRTAEDMLQVTSHVEISHAKSEAALTQLVTRMRIEARGMGFQKLVLPNMRAEMQRWFHAQRARANTGRIRGAEFELVARSSRGSARVNGVITLISPQRKRPR